jgi:hypothetical protein
MKWLVKLTLLLLLTSCSAQWHLKKAVQKDPAILEKDTLVVTTTVVSPPVAITDTVTLRQHDTITLVKDRLKVQLIKVNDTITINAECASDTIVQTINVPYDRVVYIEKESIWDKIKNLAIYMGLAFLLFKLIMKQFDK